MPPLPRSELPRNLGVRSALDLRGIDALELIVKFHLVVLELRVTAAHYQDALRNFGFFVMMLITLFTALAPHTVPPGPRITSIRTMSSRDTSCVSQ